MKEIDDKRKGCHLHGDCGHLLYRDVLIMLHRIDLTTLIAPHEITLALCAIPVKPVLILKVSHLLSDLLDDVCQPFYYKPLKLKQTNSTRRTHKVSDTLQRLCY